MKGALVKQGYRRTHGHHSGMKGAPDGERERKELSVRASFKVHSIAPRLRSAVVSLAGGAT
jgi:hypothetical protein